MVFSAEKACNFDIVLASAIIKGLRQSTKVFNVLLGNGTTHLWLLRLAPFVLENIHLKF
jgi:hypothetical protein